MNTNGVGLRLGLLTGGLIVAGRRHAVGILPRSIPASSREQPVQSATSG
jgi:hypothetical protein